MPSTVPCNLTYYLLVTLGHKGCILLLLKLSLKSRWSTQCLAHWFKLQANPSVFFSSSELPANKLSHELENGLSLNLCPVCALFHSGEWKLTVLCQSSPAHRTCKSCSWRPQRSMGYLTDLQSAHKHWKPKEEKLIKWTLMVQATCFSKVKPVFSTAREIIGNDSTTVVKKNPIKQYSNISTMLHFIVFPLLDANGNV